MNEKTVIISKNYDRIDGRDAYKSPIKQITLGAPISEEYNNMKIAAQIWKNNENGEMVLAQEIPIHQIFDLAILLSKTMMFFKEAYKLPLLYNPEKPLVDRVGVQGDALNVEICIENQNINEDINSFAQNLNDVGEIIWERQHVLYNILEELESY